ncbi:hypothetical protein BU17DRAFT_63466 [Hysterangium stoloniferum]|nr:hypothetical protein BU17DRAFT_63466 [Hysterangium stoloniferum]
MEDHLVKIHIKVKIKVAFQETNEEGVYLAGSCMSFGEWDSLLGLEIGHNMVFPTLSLQSRVILTITFASALAVGRIRPLPATPVADIDAHGLTPAVSAARRKARLCWPEESVRVSGIARSSVGYIGIMYVWRQRLRERWSCSGSFVFALCQKRGAIVFTF